MKHTTRLAMGIAILIAAGCAREERTARYQFDDSLYQPSAYGAPGTETQSTQTRASDAALESQIRQTLEAHPELGQAARDISITAQGGAVTLMGSVTSEQQKQQIAAIVQQASGATTVRNELQVSPSGSDQGAAADTTATDAGVSETDSSTSGTSSGAMGAASSTAGLSSSAGEGAAFDVTVHGTSVADQTLAQTISQDLRADTSLAPILPGIRVALENGNVTLDGHVRSEEQKRTVESAIQRIPGVTAVENNLQVGSGDIIP